MALAIERGYRVSLPFGEDCPYDLVVERNGVLERVQCKYSESDGRVVKVNCRCTNNWVDTRYTARTVDWIAAYDHTTKRCFFVPSRLLGAHGRTEMHLRLTPTANRQQAGIWWADDFVSW